MKKYQVALLLLLPFGVLTGCNNFGKEKIFDGVELYHTDKVTDAEADNLGNYLVNGKFADGETKTVQLAKSGKVYQFRFVVKDGIDKDKGFEKTVKFLATMLSAQVFGGAPVEVHLCDDQLNTLKVLSADDYGREKIFDGAQLFHTKNITDPETDSLGNYLVRAKFADGRAKSVLITKLGNTYQFKFVVQNGIQKDTAYLSNSKLFASQLSANVFNGSPVQVLMCDDYFNTLATIPMDSGIKASDRH